MLRIHGLLSQCKLVSDWWLRKRRLISLWFGTDICINVQSSWHVRYKFLTEQVYCWLATTDPPPFEIWPTQPRSLTCRRITSKAELMKTDYGSSSVNKTFFKIPRPKLRYAAGRRWKIALLRWRHALVQRGYGRKQQVN